MTQAIKHHDEEQECEFPCEWAAVSVGWRGGTLVADCQLAALLLKLYSAFLSLDPSLYTPGISLLDNYHEVRDTFLQQ